MQIAMPSSIQMMVVGGFALMVWVVCEYAYAGWQSLRPRSRLQTDHSLTAATAAVAVGGEPPSLIPFQDAVPNKTAGAQDFEQPSQVAM